jgi:hypothetical protein
MRTMSRRTSVMTIMTLATLISVYRVNSAMAAKGDFHPHQTPRERRIHRR